MKSQQQINLAVWRWSAWAPGLTDEASWHGWAAGRNAISGPVAPDVKFVAPLARRRLSSLSRMVFRSAVDCLADEQGPVSYVMCSRWGEYTRSFGILTGLARDEPASAAAFSNSVHNTSASLFAMDRHDHSQSTALAGGDATLEAGFLEAWCQLNEDMAPAVLVVYHDEPLPDLYRGQPSTIGHSAAFAMLLRLPRPGLDAIELRLAWAPHEEAPAAPSTVPDPALEVLRLLLEGGDPVVIERERLTWTWSVGGRGK